MNARFYTRLVGTVLFLKILLACAFPLLSDEAHHILWGYFPSWGHADHPAMMGWFGTAFSWLGHSALAFRTAGILVALVIGEGIRRLLAPYDAEKARLIAAIYLISPQSLFNIVVTPEIPLMFFCFLTVFCILRAHQKQSLGWALVAGLCQSAALLSKYNALWLGATAFYFFVIRPQSRSFKRTLAYGLGCLPAFAIVYWYNSHNCWINAERLLSRMNGHKLIWYGPLMAAAHQLVLGMPWGWNLFLRPKEGVNNATPTDTLAFDEFRKTLLLFVWIPFGFLAYVSLHNKIGLHWMSSFYPFFFMLLVAASQSSLQKALKWTAILSGVLTMVLATAAFVPWSYVAKITPRYHHDIVMTFIPKETCKAFHDFAGEDAVLATFDYSQSSTLWVGCNEPVLRMGHGRLDGREFDKIVDFTQYDGKKMAVLAQDQFGQGRLQGALLEARFGTFEVGGKVFHAAVGIFSLTQYKEHVLKDLLKELYDPPKRKWNNNACYFKRRYFPELVL